MNAPIKMWLFGQPFTGKTHFAASWPKPFILSTDGNARFYKDQVEYAKISSLQDFNSEINRLIQGDHDYETIILDVTEHLYDLVRDYYLAKNNVDDESEMGGFAIGWRVIRNGFWSIIKKLANTDYNVIFISHEDVTITKDALGRENFYFHPQVGNDKLRSQLSGIMQLIGRSTTTEVKIGDDIIKRYSISFGSKSNEMSGIRLPMKKLEIENTYDDLKNNIIQKQ